MIGIDFGTSNSTVARVATSGDVCFATYPRSSGEPDALFRSALFFPDPDLIEPGAPYVYCGREAIERYEASVESGRLIKSLKNFLTAESVTTRIHRKEWSLDALVALLVRNLIKFSEESLGELKGPVVVGRPVRYVHQRNQADEDRALSRVRSAFAKAGINEIHFEYEPIAAAYAYDLTLDHDEVVLVGDFGGGTSDFSVVRVGPTARKLSAENRVLARAGLGVAGDVLDGRLLYHAASPSLGLGAQCRNALTGGLTEVPRWFYSSLSDPVQHFALRDSKTLELLGGCLSEVVDTASRVKLQALKTIIAEGLSYQLFHTASYAKASLSNSEETAFQFNWDLVQIKSLVSRISYEEWIKAEVAKILHVAEQMLHAASLSLNDIDKVFLTGGTAQVPLLRNTFAEKFGAEKLVASQGFFTSVAEGLARRAEQIELAGS